jgi:hypothetical protein
VASRAADRRICADARFTHLRLLADLAEKAARPERAVQQAAAGQNKSADFDTSESAEWSKT